MDMRERFSYTQEFFTDLGDWVEAVQKSQEPELVQITTEGTVHGQLREPELLQDDQLDYIRPATTSEVAEDYPEWNPNSKEPL
jgi:hypothetical protein